jgi:hypothetical protein
VRVSGGVRNAGLRTYRGVQDEAIDATRRAGFLVAAPLANHVKDMYGTLHDLVIMSMLLGQWYGWW